MANTSKTYSHIQESSANRRIVAVREILFADQPVSSSKPYK